MPQKPQKEGKQKVCPVAARCGGCRWIHKSYQEQLEAKATFFRKLMEPYCRPEPIVAMENATHYRNKVHAVFGEDRRHGVISGIYEEKSHRIVPVDSCLIENRKADEIIVSSTSHPSMRAMELDGRAVGMKNPELVGKLREKYREETGM